MDWQRAEILFLYNTYHKPTARKRSIRPAWHDVCANPRTRTHASPKRKHPTPPKTDLPTPLLTGLRFTTRRLAGLPRRAPHQSPVRLVGPRCLAGLVGHGAGGARARARAVGGGLGGDVGPSAGGGRAEGQRAGEAPKMPEEG